MSFSTAGRAMVAEASKTIVGMSLDSVDCILKEMCSEGVEYELLENTF